MPGMNTGLSTNNPAIVSAFQAALLHQGLLVLLIVAVVATAWNVLRSAHLRQAAKAEAANSMSSTYVPRPEPVARRLLRVSFGLIWVFDGILQGQASMPLGMVPQVVQPTAAASPGAGPTPGKRRHDDLELPSGHGCGGRRVGPDRYRALAARRPPRRLVTPGRARQRGLGPGCLGLRRDLRRGICPWPDLAVRAPGAVLFYCLAGALVALPESVWSSPRLGKVVLRLMGLFFVGMALLQAWPGRGFWQGQARPSAPAGTLTGMVQQMAQTPQPPFIASWVAAFGRFDAGHGWAVNLFAVVALAGIGAGFLSGRPRPVRAAVIAGTVLCLADWVLIEDFGFLGGVGTDPNSMVPMALVFIAGYLALTRAPPSRTTRWCR